MRQKKLIALTLVFVYLCTTLGMSVAPIRAYAQEENVEISTMESSTPLQLTFVPTDDLQEGEENVAAGAEIGKLYAEGDNPPFSFELVTGDGFNDAHNALFVIDGDSVLVGPEQALLAGTYSFLVEATNDTGESLQQGFVMSVSSPVILDYPTQINATEAGLDIGFIVALDLQEGNDSVAVDSVIGTLSVSGGEGPYILTLADNEGDNHRFAVEQITEDDLTVWIVKVTQLGGLAAGSYSLVINASDISELTSQESFTLVVTSTPSNPIEEIEFIKVPNLREGNSNVSPGVAVGTLSVTGGDGGINYSLIAEYEDSARFIIEDSAVKVAPNVVFTQGSYSFKVRANDDNGYLEAVFSITIAPPAPPGNTHISADRVYLWNSGPTEQNTVFSGSKSTRNSGTYNIKNDHLEIIANPESGTFTGDFTVTTQYKTNVNLTGVASIGVRWINEGADSTENKSRLTVGGVQTERVKKFTSSQVNTIDVKHLSGNHELSLTARGFLDYKVWPVSDIRYKSHLKVYQLWLVMEQYNITVNASSGGTVEGVGGKYNYGESVRLTAKPIDGYYFEKWVVTGQPDNSSATIDVFVNNNKTVQAVFKPKTITVTTALVGPEGCGTITESSQYEYGSQITIVATANEGFGFEQWTSTITGLSSINSTWTFFVPSSDVTITGYFDYKYTIAASTSPAEGGIVTGAGDFLKNKPVTLTATPSVATGYEFVNWTEGDVIVSTDPQYVFNAEADRNLVASFRLRTEQITVLADPSWAGTAAQSGAGAYEWGTFVTAIAVSRDDYMFLNWTVDGSVVSSDASYVFQAKASRNLVANFMLKPGTFTAQPHSQFVGQPIVFDASNAIVAGGGAYTYLWTFHDETTAAGMQVNKSYPEAGDYEVTLDIYSGSTLVASRTRTVRICTELPVEQSEFRVSPQGLVWAKPGATVAWEVYLANNGIPLANRQIQIIDGVKSITHAITTDVHGKASYQTTVPSGVQQYDLRTVTFSYEVLKITRGVQLFDNNIKLSGKVFDHYTGKPIVGVTVKAGEKSTNTDSQGNYTLTGLSSGESTISAALTNYQTQSRTVVLNGLSMVHNIALDRIIPGTNPVIGRLHSQATDSTNKKDSFFRTKDSRVLTFNVDIDWRGHVPGQFVFTTSQHTYTVDAGNSLTLDVGTLIPGERMKVKAISAHGAESNLVEARFEIVPPLPISKEEKDLPLPAIDAGIITGLPFLANTNMGLDLGMVPMEVEFDEDNAEITVTIGIKMPSDEDGDEKGQIEEMKRLWNDLKKRRGMGKSFTGQPAASADVIVSGRLVFGYDHVVKQWVLVSGGVTLLVEGEISYTLYYMTPVLIPMYGQVAAGTTLDASLDLTWNIEKQKIYVHGTLTPEIYLRLALGAGIAGTLSVEGWGKALGGMKVGLIPEVKILEKYIELSLGYKITAFVFSYSQTLWGQRWPEEPQVKMMMAMPEVGQLELMSRDYLNEESQWMPVSFRAFSLMSAGLSNVEEITLQSNVYPQAGPKLVPTSDGLIMVWLIDDPARSSINRTSLVYSVYDGQKWSQPKPVDNDGTADFYPELASMTGGAVAAWVNNSTTFEDSASFAEYLTAGEIAVAFYDAATNKWSNVQNLTSDAVRDSSPKVAASGDAAIVVWTKTEDSGSASTDLLSSVLFSNPDDVMFSVWDGVAWSEPEVAVQGAGAIISSMLTMDGDNAYYAYVLDADRDLETKNDHELYLIAFEDGQWGGPVRLTNNSIQDSKPQFSTINGETKLFWYREGSIICLDMGDIEDSNSKAKTVVSSEDTSSMADFTVAYNDAGNIAVVWAEGIDGAQEIFASIYDKRHDSWSNKVQLTSNGALNRSIDATLDNDGNVLAVYGKQLVEVDVETQEIISDRTDLTYAKLVVGHDVSITSGDIMLSEENPMPGSRVTVTATVRNDGELAEKDLEVAFYDGDPADRGAQIGTTQVVISVLEAGSNVDVSVQWDIPAGFATREVYVVVDPEHKVADRNRFNNIASLSVISPDLVVNKVDWQPMGAEDYLITATVVNRGYVCASNVSLKLRKDDAFGAVLAEKNIGSLVPGQEVQETFTWTSSASEFVNGFASLCVVAVSSDSSFTSGNNTKSTLVRQTLALAGGQVESLALNVSEIALSVGAEATLIEIFTPLDATDRSVMWSSNDSSIASVSDGLVTALNVGDVVITATSVDGGYIATCNVSVLNPPTLELNGPATLVLMAGQEYVELGAVATETETGDMNGSVIVSGDNVTTSTPGTYTVTYNVTGSAGNAAPQVTRTVIVTPPAPLAEGSEGGVRTLTVTGALPTATLRLMNSSHNVVQIVTLTGVATTHTFSAVPAADGYYVMQVVNGVVSTASNTADVKADITPPVLSLLGDGTIDLLVGDSYVDAGATAMDDLDGNITFRIIVSGLPNKAKPDAGLYLIRYNVSDYAGNMAAEVIRTLAVAPNPVVAKGGYHSVHVHGAVPHSTLTLYDSRDRVRGTGSAYANGEYWFYGVASENGYYVVQTVNGAASAPSEPTDVYLIIYTTPTSFVNSRVSTADDRIIDQSLTTSGKATVNITSKPEAEAAISAGVVELLSQNNRPLHIESVGVELEFAPQSLLTSEVRTGLQATGATVVIGAKELSATEQTELLAKASVGESTGIFEIGGKIFDLSAEVRRGTATERIKDFGALVAVTIDLSHLGELSAEEIAQLVGVRLEVDAEGNVTPVALGGSYDPKTRKFTFYTEKFSLYTVMRYAEPQQGEQPENPIEQPALVIALTLGSKIATINGKEITIDVAPIAVSGRTLVPVRFVAESMGAEVDWDEDTKTVFISLDGIDIQLVVGKTDLAAGLDVPAQTLSGRTLVPLRYVSECLGATVEWFDETNSVEITR